MIALALLVLVVIVAVIVAGARKLTQKGDGLDDGGHGVRRFFQYVLLFGLLIVSAIGLTGLLTRLLEGETLVDAGQAALARHVAFTVIGLPLYLAVAVWSRRRVTQDPAELRSLGWASYLTVASVVSLIVAMFALHDVLEWLFGIERYDGGDLARLVIWGVAWASHWYVDRRVTSTTPTELHHLGGSVIGLGVATSGLVSVLSEALDLLVFSQADDLVSGQQVGLLRGAGTLLVGAIVWSVYWLATAAREERTPLWNGYVLVAGVGGGLIAAVAAASTLLFTVAVWLIGDPETSNPARHFGGAPEMVAVTALGALVWWYHREVLDAARTEARTEPRRVYEYLMAGIGLLAASTGLAILLVAFVEVVAGTSDVLVGSGATNTLLAAVTVLVVGAPVWWFFWKRIQVETTRDPASEHASPTRRTYLFLLFGVGGAAAVVALIVGAFVLFEDLFEGVIGIQTFRGTRIAVGVLITTGAIAAYHWSVYRSDRQAAPAIARQGPRFILLVGEPGAEVASEVARRTGGRVTSWSRVDGAARPWSVDEVAEATQDFDGEVIVVSDAEGLTVVPIRRGRS